MKKLDLNNKHHDLDKTNLVTVEKGGDNYKCNNCGIVGYRPAFRDYLEVKGSYSDNKIKYCNSKSSEELEYKKMVGKTIIVTRCTANGSQFSNATPDSEHVVLDTPVDQIIKDNGVWIMGNGEPIKLLNNEFYFKKLT